MVGLIVYDSGSTNQTNTSTLTLLLTKDEINFVKASRQFEVNFTQKILQNTSIFFDFSMQ